MNNTNNLVSSTIVKAPAIDDSNTMQTLALVAYANVFVYLLHMFKYLL